MSHHARRRRGSELYLDVPDAPRLRLPAESAAGALCWPTDRGELLLTPLCDSGFSAEHEIPRPDRPDRFLPATHNRPVLPTARQRTLLSYHALRSLRPLERLLESRRRHQWLQRAEKR